MKKNILLVDDEEALLISLKEGLADVPDFEIDTAHNVGEALQLLEKNSYQLIITDIRMPGKSGIDLVMNIREKKLPIGIMIMTAYGNQETFEMINQLGNINVISKPFDIDWFKEMLQTYFQQRGVSGTVESIELPSLLQIINLEKKSAEVEIEIDKKKGSIFFRDGELIHAEYADLIGEEAAIRLILLNRGHFHLKPLLKKVNQTIFVPFLPFLLNLMKNYDEKDKSFLKVSQQSHLNFQLKMRLKEIIDELHSVTGFYAAALISADGKIIYNDTISTGNDHSGLLPGISMLIDQARKTVASLEETKNLFLQLEADQITIFGSCLQSAQGHFHFLLLLAPESNIAAARIKMKKICDAITDLSKKEKLQLQ